MHCCGDFVVIILKLTIFLSCQFQQEMTFVIELHVTSMFKSECSEPSSLSI